MRRFTVAAQTPKGLQFVALGREEGAGGDFKAEREPFPATLFA